MDNSFHLIIEAIKDQKDIFGDELFEMINPDLQKKIILNVEKEEPNNFMTSSSLFENYNNCKSLDSFYNSIKDCQKCALGKSRTKFVFGTGNPNADVMIIGEAPGAEEDKQGIPFVGRAGKLLTDILKAIDFERDEVYIANILKCRPPNNRNPLTEEMNECMPYLIKQIDLIKPKAILCLGLVAATGLLNIKSSLTKLRGNVYNVYGISTMVTYHPAALLRNPNWKRGCWEDVQKFRQLFDGINK